MVRDNPEGAGGRCAPPGRLRAGLFQGPFSVSSPLALAIRAHEYGHLGLWREGLSPSLRRLRDLHRRGIHELWIQGTLDVVVNHFMMARGNGDIAELVLWTAGLYPELPRWIVANFYVRAQGLHHASLMRMSLLARGTDLTGDDLTVLDEASERLAHWGTETLPLTPRQFTQLLWNLQRRFGPDSADTEHPLARIAMCVSIAGKCQTDVLPDGLDLEDYVVREGSAGVRPKGMQEADVTIPWGPMDILFPPLTQRCRKLPGMTKRKLVCGYAGAFRFPSRALLPAADGRAFTSRHTRSAHDGTLLIDCSGSMGNQVSHDRLTAVLERCPSATIGLYAGRSANHSGSLLIAARNGMHIASEVLDSWTHWGNVVDGPALQWLSRQKPPRVWVSDGGVTGLDDQSAANLQIEVDMLTTTARIRRVATLDEYLREEE